MSRKRYPKIKDGEEIAPNMTGYRMACCDCGLVHELDFKVVRVQSKTSDGFTHNGRALKGVRVLLVARRNERATSAFRRHHYAGKKPHEG